MAKTIDIETLPYRPCVGALVLNAAGLAFIGQRTKGPEHSDAVHSWQLPQGGIDAGEDPAVAVMRELYEETSIRSAEIIAEAPEWFSYDIPRDVVGQAWKGKYRGQTQKWFALRFTGDEAEINVLEPGGGHTAEFSAWKWERLELLPELIVPFKRPVYERVVETFRHLV
ncbi:MAG: RNA pyrophosphohydrolase [Hyphomicrobiales bacterium]